MGTQDNVQVVKQGYAAFGRRDIPGLVALLAEDVEWHIPGEGPSFAGTYHGHKEVTNFFQNLARELDIQDFQPREFVAEGDHVMVIGWERAKLKSTNRTIELDWVMDFTVRNGKIAKFRQYTDTQAIAKAYAESAKTAR